MREEKITQIKNIIKNKFYNKKFTCGDIYYSIEKEYNKSELGTIRNILVKLTKEGFLDYVIEMRGSPHYDSENKKKGATYTLKKKYELRLFFECFSFFQPLIY